MNCDSGCYSCEREPIQISRKKWVIGKKIERIAYRMLKNTYRQNTSRILSEYTLPLYRKFALINENWNFPFIWKVQTRIADNSIRHIAKNALGFMDFKWNDNPSTVMDTVFRITAFNLEHICTKSKLPCSRVLSSTPHCTDSGSLTIT